MTRRFSVRGARSLGATFAIAAVWLGPFALSAQQRTDTLTRRDTSADVRDSVFLEGVERVTESPKVYHAEPIAIDLMRDLGARKGEAEWNLGLAQKDKRTYDELLLFVEYEWAPINRLGLEVEVPMVFHAPLGTGGERVPRDQIEGLKLAGMYTLQVDTMRHWSTAIGYLHEVLLNETNAILLRRPVDGQLFNPFLVTARRWTDNWHSLLYTGPRLVRRSGGGWEKPAFEANWNVHFMVPGTRNFVGLEVNQSVENRRSNFVLRPQMRVGITDHFLVGIAGGIPVNRDKERVGTFIRLIYEPRSGNKGHGRTADHASVPRSVRIAA
jgi:hypothetical protein